MTSDPIAYPYFDLLFHLEKLYIILSRSCHFSRPLFLLPCQAPVPSFPPLPLRPSTSQVCRTQEIQLATHSSLHLVSNTPLPSLYLAPLFLITSRCFSHSLPYPPPLQPVPQESQGPPLRTLLLSPTKRHAHPLSAEPTTWRQGIRSR